MLSLVACMLIFAGTFVLCEGVSMEGKGEAFALFVLLVGALAIAGGVTMLFSDDGSEKRADAAHTKATKLCDPLVSHVSKVEDKNVLLVTCGNSNMLHKITWK